MNKLDNIPDTDLYYSLCKYKIKFQQSIFKTKEKINIQLDFTYVRTKINI